MNFFKIKTGWSNAEFIPLKLCIATAYILIGAYFHNFFRDHYVAVLIAYHRHILVHDYVFWPTVAPEEPYGLDTVEIEDVERSEVIATRIVG